MERNKNVLPFILISSIVFAVLLLLKYFVLEYYFSWRPWGVSEYWNLVTYVLPILIVGIVSAVFISKKFTVVIYVVIILKELVDSIFWGYIDNITTYFVILFMLFFAIIVGNAKFRGKTKNIVVLVVFTLVMVIILVANIPEALRLIYWW